MDFSGSNRGYMFVRYTCRDDAKRAIRELNNFEIRPGKFIGVIPSVDNRKLWISGIPQNRSAEEIKVKYFHFFHECFHYQLFLQTEMAKITDGVRSVHLCPNPTDMSKTRGYAFVEYETHRAAALARRKLVPGRIFLFDQEIEKVDWAEPENEVDDEVMAKVSKDFDEIRKSQFHGFFAPGSRNFHPQRDAAHLGGNAGGHLQLSQQGRRPEGQEEERLCLHPFLHPRGS